MSGNIEKGARAIASIHRLHILRWLKDPRGHFPPQCDGDLVTDGVCALLIADKLGLAQATTAQHLKALVAAGLIIPKKIGKWTLYRRDEAKIAALMKALDRQIG